MFVMIVPMVELEASLSWVKSVLGSGGVSEGLCPGLGIESEATAQGLSTVSGSDNLRDASTKSRQVEANKPVLPKSEPASERPPYSRCIPKSFRTECPQSSQQQEPHAAVLLAPRTRRLHPPRPARSPARLLKESSERSPASPPSFGDAMTLRR